MDLRLLITKWRNARETMLIGALVSGCLLAATDDGFFIVWSAASAVGALVCHGLVELLSADLSEREGLS